jgi:exo-beta-1,3-glucanase (GH17 family)/cellulose synthase/poly-beta-1,6-N-acetylglucosamine synthase-like glycosyltransferase
MKPLGHTLLILLAVVLANFVLWGMASRSAIEQPWGGVINAFSYSGWQAGDQDNKLSDADIARDMELLKAHTNALRTYGVSDGLDRILPIAAQHGLQTIVGGWLGRDAKVNQAELDRLVAVVKNNPGIHTVMVGNEALLRTDMTVEQLITAIEQVKRQIDKPVSTAEPWHVWLKHPELVNAVDFITVHILPYWEGLPIDKAVDYVQYRMDQLRTTYPDKHIFIGEVGWPSEGQWVKASEPSQINQARFIRQFLNLATEQRYDYSIVEAFDEPWKRRIEGSVGAHWGLWDTNREPKFPLSGKVVESTTWLWGLGLSSLLALLPIIGFIRWRRDLRPTGKLFYALLLQIVFSLLVWAIMVAMAEKVINGTTMTWVALIGAQIILLALLLVDGLELTEVVWANRRRAFKPLDWQPGDDAPKVSIHVPCYNEPPEMVKLTLDALAALNYPNFEVLVVDNNTKDEAVWKPLEEYCARLGPRFRFFHLPQWPGYKAGALNFALTQTAADARIVGVIDSDYIVSPDWLRHTVKYFEKPEVAIVQAPQDYRDGSDSLFKRMAYWEYAGFFHIGMVQRNERNAIIQHGTMTLIRKATLQSVQGWAEWCICEDAELGLRMFQNGYEAVYLEDSMGRGLIPDDFSGYKTQRFRWAYGAVQILKRHWRELSEGGGKLSRGQRYHFISGWLPWFADAAHMVFSLAAIFWSVLLLMKWVEFPPAVFLVPTLSVFVFKVVAGFWLYHARVKCGWKDRIGAAIAGMSLTHAVGRAVWQGLFTSGKPFFRTPKMADQPAAVQAFLMAREEIALLAGLLMSAGAVLQHYSWANFDAKLWAGMLLVNTLPYWAALIMGAVNALPSVKLQSKPELKSA